MAGKQAGSHPTREIKRSLDRRILRSTTVNVLILVVICCVIMALALQSLANNILLDSLQPMARQSAKTVEANIHMLPYDGNIQPRGAEGPGAYRSFADRF